jgi:hypothetical protein
LVDLDHEVNAVYGDLLIVDYPVYDDVVVALLLASIIAPAIINAVLVLVAQQVVDETIGLQQAPVIYGILTPLINTVHGDNKRSCRKVNFIGGRGHHWYAEEHNKYHYYEKKASIVHDSISML